MQKQLIVVKFVCLYYFLNILVYLIENESYYPPTFQKTEHVKNFVITGEELIKMCKLMVACNL